MFKTGTTPSITDMKTGSGGARGGAACGLVADTVTAMTPASGNLTACNVPAGTAYSVYVYVESAAGNNDGEVASSPLTVAYSNTIVGTPVTYWTGTGRYSNTIVGNVYCRIFQHHYRERADKESSQMFVLMFPLFT